MTQKSYAVLFMRDPARTGRPLGKIVLDKCIKSVKNSKNTKTNNANIKNVRLTKISLAFFFFLVK